MALIFNGSYDELQSRATKRLAEAGFSVTPGSVAKLLVSIINSEIADFYTMLEEAHLQSFITTASGEFLDAIGILLNCVRKEDEDDKTFRVRITKQILTTASSNLTAIRLAALSVEGVSDVVIKNYSHGAGTFTIIILSDEYDIPETVLLNVSNALSDVVAYGTKYHVDKATYDTISLDINLVLNDVVDEVNARDIKFRVKENIKEYISSLSLGETFFINELTQRIMETSEYITTYVCNSFKINDEIVKFVNQECSWANKFIVSAELDAININ